MVEGMLMAGKRSFDVTVVGAGFAGLYSIHRMRELGFSVHAFEIAPDVGGVWHWNRYPGARCDVESLQYSYSFSKELEQEWQWTERYAAQPEILSYIKHVADRFDLRRDISFGVRVEKAVWDEDRAEWTVHTSKGEVYTCRFCIMASGSLSVSRLPDIPGLDSFEGETVHTGMWPDRRIELKNKRVAVIGTGSSGIQAIPVIAEQAERLTVFQRTPNFVVPARNRPLDDETQKSWKERYEHYRARAREVGTLYEFSSRGALEVSEEERQQEYERRWAAGGVNFVHSFNNIYTNEAANVTAADFVRGKIRQIVKNPEVAEKLCPSDHPLGSKRICVASDYYETYNRPNVELVDIREEEIERITAHGIRTSRNEYPTDVIVFATGYDALTGALTRIDIRSRHAQSLKEKWEHGPRNYLGLMTAGFPNMFIITGPGSPSALVNMIVGIEQHVDWISECLVYLRANGVARIDADPEAESMWVQHVNEAADKTLFVKANSWYLGANIPGKPRVFMPYVSGIGVYRRECDDVAAKDYEGFILKGDVKTEQAS
jgi:cyclohexanone monooxygenase